MREQQGVVRSISWSELFPWLLLFRCFRLAISVPVLTLAFAGVLIVPLGWRVSHMLFIRDVELGGNIALAQVVDSNDRWPIEIQATPAGVGQPPATRLNTNEDAASYLILFQVYRQLVVPAFRIGTQAPSWGATAYYFVGQLWMLCVWALLGGAISRTAVMQLGRQERVGFGEALKFSAGRFRSFLGAPLFPVVGIFFVMLPLWFARLLMMADVGVLINGIAWLLLLGTSLLLTICVIGVTFGWPLMWGAVSAERDGDVYGAFSRSYSYVYQRPLQYLFYFVVASLFGVLCWLFTYHFTEAVVWFASTSAGFAQAVEPTTGPRLWGEWLIGFFNAAARTIPIAFCYSFFWCSFAAIYLLLRRDTDQTDFDDVFAERDDDKRMLPGMKADKDGVPQLAS